jgi:hypothetical protein
MPISRAGALGAQLAIRLADLIALFEDDGDLA